MSQPFFSIIVPVHNAATYIDKCINSIINQSFKDYEVVIIDDKSSDNTVDIINRIITGLKNFKIFELKKNVGVSGARNVGIKLSVGKYICFLDDDDLWLQDKLKIEHEHIIKKKLNWIFSNYEVLDENYRHLGTRFRMPGFYDYKKMISHGNPVGMLTVAVKADILKENYFKNVGHEDYDLWLRLSRKGYRGYLIKDVLAQYLKRNNSRSSNKIRSIVWTFKCFKRNGCSNFKALFFVFSYAFNVYKRRNEL